MQECWQKYFYYNDELRPVAEFEELYSSTDLSLYEAIRVVDGIPLFFELYMQRLQNSARCTNRQIWLHDSDIYLYIKKLIDVNNFRNGNVKLIFRFGANDTQSFYCYFNEHYYPTKEQYTNGVKVELFNAERVNPNAKIVNKELRDTTNLLKNKTQAHEIILIDHDGYISEGSRSNIFFIRDHKIVTTPKENVLPGVTRSIVIDICRKSGIELIEKKIHKDEIKLFDASFISSTSNKVLPVLFWGDFKLNVTNEILIRLMLMFDNKVNDYLLQQPGY